MSVRPRLPLVLALVLAGTAGCGEEADEREEDGEPAAASGAAPAESDHEAYLRSIGYAGFDDAAVGGPDGVVQRDAARSVPGYDLYSVVPQGVHVLLDPDGRELRRWQVDDAVWAMRAELLPDGDVVLVGSEGDPRDARAHLVRMSWSGQEVWRRDEDVHHDVELTPRGELLTLASAPRELPELDPDRPVEDNLVLRVSLDGELLQSLSLHDALVASGFELHEPPHQGLTGEWYDHLHANSVAWIPDALVSDRPLYGAEHVLVSLRHQHTVAMVDMASGRVVWTWGRGELVMQHEASWLPDGSVLLFDNGNEDRPWSRLVIVDPRSDTILWQWTAPRPRDFYSAGRGTVQALPGGNLLVSNSNKGEVFEITRAGEPVWRFLGPHRDDRGRRGALRLTRYPVEYVEAILARVDG